MSTTVFWFGFGSCIDDIGMEPKRTLGFLDALPWRFSSRFVIWRRRRKNASTIARRKVRVEMGFSRECAIGAGEVLRQREDERGEYKRGF